MSRIELYLTLELDSRSLETHGMHPAHQLCSGSLLGIDLYESTSVSLMVGNGSERLDTDLAGRHQAHLPEDAAGVYVRAHAVPPGPRSADGFPVVLVCFLGAVDLYQEFVLAGHKYPGNVELERGEVSLVAAHADPVQPHPRRVVDAAEPEKQHRVFGRGMVREPAPVQHEALVRRKGVFQLPVSGDPDRGPRTPYAPRVGRVLERGGQGHRYPVAQDQGTVKGRLSVLVCDGSTHPEKGHKKWATTYSPTGSPPQYHRRWRA